ncbi:MAG TPA: LptF/LptG family permease [Longimicrobiales bacterium]|nr:LptF/LptG family permease [Longimicrobiales bacterium]
MRILDRLVMGQFVKLFAVSILATPPLFVLGELTEDLDSYVDQGMTTLQVAHGYLYRLPEYIVWSFPIAALIAAVFTIHTLTVHREIVAAKAGGISFHRLILPVGVMAVLLTGAALALTELAPRSNRIAFQILENVDPRREWRSNFVYQTEGGLTVASRRLVVADGRLVEPVVQRPPDAEGPVFYLDAQEAVHDSVSGWDFHKGHLRVVKGPEDVVSYAFDQMYLPGLTERPEELLETPPEDEEMTYAEIGRLARIIERSGGSPDKLLVRKEQKLAIPVATLVIILFGAPLATSSKRGGAAYGIGIALGTTLLYLLMLKVAGGFGASGTLPPMAAAWLPNALFLVAGTVLMAKVRT